MKSLDTIFLTSIVSACAMLFKLQHYSLCIFMGGLFLIFLATVSIHYLSSPLPRFVIGTATILDPVEESEKGDS